MYTGSKWFGIKFSLPSKQWFYFVLLQLNQHKLKVVHICIIFMLCKAGVLLIQIPIFLLLVSLFVLYIIWYVVSQKDPRHVDFKACLTNVVMNGKVIQPEESSFNVSSESECHSSSQYTNLFKLSREITPLLVSQTTAWEFIQICSTL